MLADADSWALFFHLLGAFLFVGGVIVAGVAFEAARRRHQPGEIALLLGLTRIGVLLVALGALVVLRAVSGSSTSAGSGTARAGWTQRLRSSSR